MSEIGHVELNFSVEPADHRIDEIGVFRRKSVERGEDLGIHPRDAIENAGLDMVHAGRFRRT